ncbi:MAG: VTT domain-containing protein [Bacilli bacterium]|nr:VTT domain-containing protein [Bacilli bacterium]
MIDLINTAIDFITNAVQTLGPVFGFLLIITESIIPILPLAVFIALNVISFGPVVGFIMSWVATIIGSLLSFYIFRKGFSKKLYKNIKTDGKIQQFMDYISNFHFTQLVLLIALPFTPAFAVNIAAGLSKIPVKKFLLAIIIAKLSIVYFWGWVGTSFLESVSNPMILVKIGIIMGITYLVSFVIKKVLKIKEE